MPGPKYCPFCGEEYDDLHDPLDDPQYKSLFTLNQSDEALEHIARSPDRRLWIVRLYYQWNWDGGPAYIVSDICAISPARAFERASDVVERERVYLKRLERERDQLKPPNDFQI
jgi:hypothetical protein